MAEAAFLNCPLVCAGASVVTACFRPALRHSTGFDSAPYAGKEVEHLDLLRVRLPPLPCLLRVMHREVIQDQEHRALVGHL